MMMEDNLVDDFPHDNLIPRVPPKTYKWEDVRRQKLEGSYPWTHVNKPPFDPEVWEREKSLEYEPVGSMETRTVKITTAIIPPMVKITDVDTLNRETSTTTADNIGEVSSSSSCSSEKRYLQIPNGDEDDTENGNERGVIIEEFDGNDCEDNGDEGLEEEEEEQSDADDEDDEELLSPQDFQSRVEERFFSSSDVQSSSSAATAAKHEAAPSLPPKSTSLASREKTRSQIDRIKKKFENFREQQAKREESTSLSSERFKNKLLKFKLKKPNIHLEKPKIHLPSMSSLRPNISFPNLHFSLSRSNSIKSVDQISTTTQQQQPKRKFDFSGTYPRIFKKKKKNIVEPDDYYEQVGPAVVVVGSTKSAPGTPLPKRSPAATGAFSQKLLNKFKNIKDSATKNSSGQEEDTANKDESDVIHSSIVISMKAPKSSIDDKVEPEEKPTNNKMIIDNKNFFFISLHEDRTDLKPPPWKHHANDDDDDVDVEKTDTDRQTDVDGDKSTALISEKMPLKRLNVAKQSLWNFALKNKEHLKEANILESSSGVAVVESKESLEETSNERIILDECDDLDFPPSTMLETSERDANLEEEQDLQPAIVIATKRKVDISDDPTIDGDEILEIPEPKPRTKKKDDHHRQVAVVGSILAAATEFHSIEDISADLIDDRQHFEEYESALEKSKLSSDYYSAVEISGKDNAVYSSDNALARLDFGEPPRSPVPPMRTRSLYRNKQQAKRPTRRGGAKKSTMKSPPIAAAAPPTGQPELPPYEGRKTPDENLLLPPYSIYNTFPSSCSNNNRRPERPKRRFKTRYPSSACSSTTNMMDEDMNDVNFNNNNNNRNNIASSKQMSVSYLPLTSDTVVTNGIVSCYDLRETSSMIQLNITDPPQPAARSSRGGVPVPPKRRKSFSRAKIDETRSEYRTDDGSRSSLAVATRSVTPNILHGGLFHTDELEYADDGTKTPDEFLPPARPLRKKSFSTLNLIKKKPVTTVIINDFTTPRSNRKDDDAATTITDRSSLCGDDPPTEDGKRNNNNNNGYAVIGKPTSHDEGQPRSGSLNIDSIKNNNSANHRSGSEDMSSLRRRIRRISDFFTLPRIRRRDNYVHESEVVDDGSVTLPQPIRPPRRYRSFREHLYDEDGNSSNLSSDDERKCRSKCSSSKRAGSLPCGIDDEARYLQSGIILEKMKGRPLPAPPRPCRKTKEDQLEHQSDDIIVVDNNNKSIDIATYSRCNKRDKTPSISHSVNILAVENNKEKSIERKIINTEFRRTNRLAAVDNSSSTVAIQTDSDEPNSNNSNNSNNNTAVFTSLRVSELNVDKLNVNEIESSRLIASSIESVSLLVSDPAAAYKSEHVKELLLLEDDDSSSSINPENYNNNKRLESVENVEIFDSDDKSTATTTTTIQEASGGVVIIDNDQLDNDSIDGRSRISSMIPEVGSDIEDDDTGRRRRIVPPMRRKNSTNTLLNNNNNNSNNNKQRRINVATNTIDGAINEERTNKEASSSSSSTNTESGGNNNNNNNNNPTLSELTRQILEICQSSVGQAIHSMVEQFAPENREKRNELQTAIWIITIIVAGCLVLGLGGSEKQVHHHHWDFHFPPPR